MNKHHDKWTPIHLRSLSNYWGWGDNQPTFGFMGVALGPRKQASPWANTNFQSCQVAGMMFRVGLQEMIIPYPRWSMYGIFTYIWVIYRVNVGKYTGRTEGLPGTEWVLLKEAHFTAQAQCFMALVHLWVIMFHVKFSEKSVGKVNPLRTSCMLAFSRFSLFGVI